MSSKCRHWTKNVANCSGLHLVSLFHSWSNDFKSRKTTSSRQLTRKSPVPIYWALAWILAAAVPQISNLTSFVGAACILQFSYTFPPILLVGYNCQKDAMLPEEEFDPRTGVTTRVDSGWKRWMRGYKKKFAINTFDVLYSLAALATAGLGLYASGTGMRETFKTTKLTPFTCKNPAG